MGVTAFAADGVPVEFARSFVRGDRTRYYVERLVVRSPTAPVEEPVALPESMEGAA